MTSHLKETAHTPEVFKPLKLKAETTIYGGKTIIHDTPLGREYKFRLELTCPQHKEYGELFASAPETAAERDRLRKALENIASVSKSEFLANPEFWGEKIVSEASAILRISAFNDTTALLAKSGGGSCTEAVKNEREACAKVAEECKWPDDYADANTIAAAIRARGEGE